MKKVLRIGSLVFGIAWLAVLAASAVMRSRPGEDGWGRMVYGLFVIVGAMGALSSALLFLTLLAERLPGPEGLKRAALISAGGCNLSFYLLVALLFPVNRDWLGILLVLWSLFTAAGLITLTATGLLTIKKRGRPQPPGPGAGKS